MSELATIREDLPPQFEQDPGYFDDFIFLGRVSMGSEVSDAYVHARQDSKTDVWKPIGIASRHSDDPDDYGYMGTDFWGTHIYKYIVPWLHPELETERDIKRYPSPTIEAAKLAIKHGYLTEEQLCEYTTPYELSLGVPDFSAEDFYAGNFTKLQHHIAKLHGYGNFKEWYEAYCEAESILRELKNILRPTAWDRMYL